MPVHGLCGESDRRQQECDEDHTQHRVIVRHVAPPIRHAACQS
jgi:hypothetical protein